MQGQVRITEWTPPDITEILRKHYRNYGYHGSSIPDITETFPCIPKDIRRSPGLLGLMYFSHGSSSPTLVSDAGLCATTDSRL